ncbi:carbohydrate binding family 9 domain-containing protein [Candidatus Aminicenantes bacterium AC-335-B20]|nr:carbohydrate binding family 9 domain-containing protein [SCandidatus Aminicenantes bacterium Aminicenantia_JdfR_composite]MCP2598252.1 carbohydrate binding family 9 domain-containing protein [Candidatus Aminicenantes bacterium AC-335-L06]MCP2598884.1 carbohydrate binding family 9 domain-containing protein [Candidatus Aminicenantes bacterium AC-335-B20]
MIKKIFLIQLILFACIYSLAYDVNLKAIRINKGPRIDGNLTDEVWQEAIPFTDFKMVEPYPQQEPTEKTELRILYDDENLYIGIYCYDSEVSKISANSMAFDQREKSDDIVRILLDPFQDKRTAYVFFVNPRGARSDGLALGEHFSLNWDGIWDAKAKIHKDGWSVEIKIPFKTISFNSRLNAWGLNIERYIPRKQEVIRLSGISRDSFFYNPVEASLLSGIENIKQGMGLTIRPYGIIETYRNKEISPNFSFDRTGGFDIYKHFTPNFVGVFSYNTDFAETEVDERRINLTRFPLYFPEKRAFFLEGSEIFSFGLGLQRSFIPFFSRRIGLYESRQVPIEFGLKIYGKLGNTNLSILDVKTKPFEDLPAKNFIAGRVYQNIFSQSKVGFIFTNGNPSGNSRNSLFGIDFTYVTSKFRGDKNLFIGGWWVYNWNELKLGKHYGYGFMIDYPNDLLDAIFIYHYFGDSLNPGLGFLPRNNVQTLRTGFAYRPRPEKGIIGKLVRQFFFELYGTFYWDLNGKLETRRIFTAPINLRTESGEHIEFNVIPNMDVLPYDFEVAKGVIIPAGTYKFTNYRFEFNSASYRKVKVDISYRFGEFYSGKYKDLNLGFGFKYKGYVTFQLNFNLVRGDLPQGKFSENVYRLKADFYFTPNLGLLNYIQYDDISKQLGANIRLKWRISPGNYVYLVYNSTWERRWDPISRFVPLESKGVFKITLSWKP